jgi:predicted phage tail protein
MLTKIKLLGVLGEEFVKEIKLCVNSVHEAMWALCNIYPRFKPWVIEQGRHGLAYEVFVGDWQIEEKHLGCASGGADITVIPTILGSGGGLGKILLGVALIGIGVFSGGAGFLGLSSTSLLLSGGALLLSGLVGGKQPKAEDKGVPNSLIFNSQPAVTKVGAAKPLVFGVMLTTPIIISARIRTYQLS